MVKQFTHFLEFLANSGCQLELNIMSDGLQDNKGYLDGYLTSYLDKSSVHKSNIHKSNSGKSCRVAVISMHTSPLAQPGCADSGGMNVYVRELSAAMAHRGHDVTVYVRRSSDSHSTQHVEAGVSVVSIPCGPLDLPKEQLPAVVGEFTDKVEADILRRGGVDIIHAHYWLSGMAGHTLKHRLNLPLVTSFHTLARTKWQASGQDDPQERATQEQAIINCSDAVAITCESELEQLLKSYDQPGGMTEIVPPGVEHAFFSPGDKAAARRALKLPDAPILLFVGRINPLKNPALAVRTLAALSDSATSEHNTQNRDTKNQNTQNALKFADARLILAGGPSGADGEAELRRTKSEAERLGVADRVIHVPAQSHRMLSSYYRASDVVLIPSRSESFGLVALEAASSGTPVVAASVGGLRSLVQQGKTGFLVEGFNETDFARRVAQILSDDGLAVEMALNGVDLAAGYSWETAAQLLEEVYGSVFCREVLDCLV